MAARSSTRHEDLPRCPLPARLDLGSARDLDRRRRQPASLRQLLNHARRIRTWPSARYAAAVRHLVDRGATRSCSGRRAGGIDFEPGTGWAYSNTGYLLVRRIVDAAAPGGFAGLLGANCSSRSGSPRRRSRSSRPI